MTTFTVGSGQTSTGISLNNGDIENILNGGTANATAINSGGSAHVSSGGNTSGSVVFKGGNEFVLNGGTAATTTISSGGIQFVSVGGVAVDTTVKQGGFQFVSGSASNVTVSSGGVQDVVAGKASGTIVEAGGSETVETTGTAVGMVVNGGAHVIVQGSANTTHLNNGAVEQVFGLAIGTVVSSGGTEVISSFFGTNGSLFNTVMQVGGTIDVTFLPFASGGSASFSASTHKLTVSQGGHTYSQTLSGSYTSNAFELVSDGGTGTLIVLACFRRGTRICTATDGAVAIEALREGDCVRTLDGTEPIVWIGYRSFDCRRHPAPHLVWPVRVSAHALGAGLPRHDLWLSPGHALFIDGVLIPVKFLIDGDAVAQVPMDSVEYWHLELPRHAVLIAEGLPVESYLDAGDRAHFDNGRGSVTQYSDFASRLWEAKACAPLIVGGPRLALARALVAHNARPRTAA